MTTKKSREKKIAVAKSATPNIQGRPTRRTLAKHGGEKISIESRLLAATERLLEKGHKFAALTTDDLATEAGIARATFYLHFRDKGELVARIMGQLTEELVRSNGEWLSEGEDLSPESVQKAVSGTVKTFKKHQAIVAAINDTAPFDDNVATQYLKMIDAICAQSRRSFSTVRRHGQSKAGATDDVSDILTWMVVLYTARFVNRSSGADLARLAKAISYICNSAIFPEFDE